MPMVSGKLMESVPPSGLERKKTRELSDTMLSTEGQSQRPVTLAGTEELDDGDRGLAGDGLAADADRALASDSSEDQGTTGASFPNEVAMYDMKNLAKFKNLGELAPDAFKAFVAFDGLAFKAGAIPAKFKELMAIAVALTTQCPYCIEIHRRQAKKAGATEQELAETTLVASALRAGSAMTHGTHTME
jgi:AhpD family alkylhydroperoxidase